MKNFEELTKEELLEILDEQNIKYMKEKATLKEITTTHLLKEDTLFIIPSGFIIGKPYIDDKPIVSGYIILSEVLLLDSLTEPIKSNNFHKMCFQLAIDQIIAFTPIDRESFLNQLGLQQES